MGKVLVACEYSGRVRQAFRDRGHDAWSCDLLESEDNSQYHIQGYVDDLLKEPWDMVIAHPPCTYLCNSGVRWLHSDPERWELMRDGALFFVECLHANSYKVAVENPVMHKYAKKVIEDHYLYPDPYSWFSVQPWQFGDPAKKRTCFWKRGLPALYATSDMTANDAKPDVHNARPGPQRWKERSRTYKGIAEAIADQWGSILE